MSKSVILKCYIIFNFIVPICEAATSLKPLSLSRSLSLTLRLRSQLSSRPLLSVASPLHNHSPSRGALAAAAAPVPRHPSVSHPPPCLTVLDDAAPRQEGSENVLKGKRDLLYRQKRPTNTGHFSFLIIWRRALITVSTSFLRLGVVVVKNMVLTADGSRTFSRRQSRCRRSTQPNF